MATTAAPDQVGPPAGHLSPVAAEEDRGRGAARLLAAGLWALGALIATYAVLGPLVLGVIEFRTSESGLDQVRGGDLAALVVVVPCCLGVGWLARRGHPAAPVLALAPSIFAMYTYSQLVLGNEYLYRPGNVERFFPLLLVIFLLAAATALRSWGLARPETLPASSCRLDRGSGVLLVVIGAFVVLGLHLPGILDAVRDRPTGAAYLDAPTLFWVVNFYDLGIVALAALVVGVGLLRRRPWARRPAYAILGGYVLVGWSVAGMGWSMLIGGDPDASAALSAGITAIAAAGAVFAWFLYRPLFRPVLTPLADGKAVSRLPGGSRGRAGW